MKPTSLALALAGATLAGCKGQTFKDADAQNVYQGFDNQADAIDLNARNAHSDNVKRALRDQADAIRAEGRARAEAIEDSHTLNTSDASGNTAP